MLFDVEDITCDKCTDLIQTAVHAIDPAAKVTVDRTDKRVRIEGLLSEDQAIAALQAVGYAATTAAPHSGEGSQCCGGCS